MTDQELAYRWILRLASKEEAVAPALRLLRDQPAVELALEELRDRCGADHPTHPHRCVCAAITAGLPNAEARLRRENAAFYRELCLRPAS